MPSLTGIYLALAGAAALVSLAQRLDAGIVAPVAVLAAVLAAAALLAPPPGSAASVAQGNRTGSPAKPPGGGRSGVEGLDALFQLRVLASPDDIAQLPHLAARPRLLHAVQRLLAGSGGRGGPGRGTVLRGAAALEDFLTRVDACSRDAARAARERETLVDVRAEALGALRGVEFVRGGGRELRQVRRALELVRRTTFAEMASVRRAHAAACAGDPHLRAALQDLGVDAPRPHEPGRARTPPSTLV